MNKMGITKEGSIWKAIKDNKSDNGAMCEYIKELKKLIIGYKATNLSLEERIKKLEESKCQCK